MSLIPPADAAKVQTFLQDRLQGPVVVDVFSQKRSPLVVPGRRECEYCEETQQLAEEVGALSDKIQVAVHDLQQDPEAGKPFGISAGDIPAIVIRGQTKGAVRYFGIPGGYEFTGFLETLANASTGDTALTEATRNELANLPGDVHIRVFVTPT
jgi:glutaredoxin